MDEISFVAYLQGTVSGIQNYVYTSYLFFKSDKFNVDFPDTWLPYKGMPQRSILTSQIANGQLRQMIEMLVEKLERAYALNERWTRELLYFFDLPIPTTLKEWEKFRKVIDMERVAQGATWMSRPECQVLAIEMEQVLAEINQLLPSIHQQMAEVYGDLFFEEEEFGTQEAKDLIDIANGEPDVQKAIKLLEQALAYGEMGIQASKAYMELGMRYEDLGEIGKAIEHYTKSLTAWKPFGLGYFWRGRLFYTQGQWEDARSDFEQALTFAPKGGLPSPEREEAAEYLAKLKEKK